MDWDNVRGEKPRPPMSLPTLKLLETCWRLQTPSGRIIDCGIYRTDAPGLGNCRDTRSDELSEDRQSIQ